MTVDSLDDAKALKRADPEGMLAAVEAFPQMWEEAYAAGSEATVDVPDDPSSLVVLGMGGSGVTGDVVRAALEPTASFPVIVCKGYELPAFVDKQTLVVAVSYSGQTEETLDTLGQAMERGATIVGVASGGRLAEACKSKSWPWLAVPKDLQPRAALPWLSGTTLGFLDTAGLAGRTQRDTSGLQDLCDVLAPGRPRQDNPAKELAKELTDAYPVAYGWGPQAVAALRFKCQVNENAKMFARNEQMPESNHNDMVAWGSLPKDTPTHLVNFRARDEPPAIKARFRFLSAVAQEHHVPVHERTPSTAEPVGGLLENIMFADFVSVYMAILRGVDPSPVDVIHRLKKSLETGGRIQEAAARLGV